MAQARIALPDDLESYIGRWAKVRAEGDKIIVTARYVAPRWMGLLSALLGAFWAMFAAVIPLWAMFRLYTPEGARYLAPGFDGFVGWLVSFTNAIAAMFISPRFNLEFGPGMTLVTMAGALILMVIVWLIVLITYRTKWDQLLFSRLIRSSLKVVFSRDGITFGRRFYPRIAEQGFSRDEHTRVRNRTIRSPAYDSSRSIMFEYGYNRMTVADVCGVERAEGILGALHMADRLTLDA